MRLAWLTDIHLNLLSTGDRRTFLDAVNQAEPDAVLIGGDIGESDTVCTCLQEMEDLLQRDIYFVLGNHDYYRSSISQVRLQVSNLARNSRWLNFLPDVRIVELTQKTALVGHGAWADGRLGNYMKSELILNDYIWIKEFNPTLFMLSDGKDIGSHHPGSSFAKGGQAKQLRLKKMNDLGDEAAKHIKQYLSKALELYENVILLTHVPPFKDACWHEGRISDDEALPHFSCKAVGEVVLRLANEHSKKQITVLCGHTHSSGITEILPNLKVFTGGAEYGSPSIQRIIGLI